MLVSWRNARWAFIHGGKEFGRSHYPVMVGIHAGSLAGCLIEVWVANRRFIAWLGWSCWWLWMWRFRRYGVRRHYRVPAWSEFLEVHWSRWGEAYVTPVQPDLVGVAILSRHRPNLSWFPWLAHQLRAAATGRVPPGRRAGAAGG